MNDKEKIRLLEIWLARYWELDRQMDALGAVTGCAPDSPLGNSVWRMFDSYTAAVGQLAGDEGDWLCWFIYENDCGKKAGEVTKGKGKPRKIKTLGDLLWCIKP